MTPISPVPNHENDKQSSTVFHRDRPGKVVAKFFGPNHRSDANEFVGIVTAGIEPKDVASYRDTLRKVVDGTIPDRTYVQKVVNNGYTETDPSSRPLDAE